MRIPISEDKVSKVQHPYFIWCHSCDRIIEGETAEKVVKSAESLDWEYDTETNEISCHDCKTKKEGK